MVDDSLKTATVISHQAYLFNDDVVRKPATVVFAIHFVVERDVYGCCRDYGIYQQVLPNACLRRDIGPVHPRNRKFSANKCSIKAL